MDVEEYVRRRLAAGDQEVEVGQDLSAMIMTWKNATPAYAGEFSRAVVEEVKNTRNLSGDLFAFEPAGVGMGEFGVGSRGTGDFYAHRQIARVIGSTSAEVGVGEMDDGGVVRSGAGEFIVCTVDGMHSRLSDFPFLAGFHVTRATLRDVYVMGARPVMLFSDIHVADDGDVGKIFDYTAGITTVGDLVGVPLVSGSTLRIGGDMVLGSRMTGCVGSVGVASHITPRRATAPGDLLLMTTGAGGGTIATAAMYSGYPDVVESTMNLDFLRAAKALVGNEVLRGVHAMTDVTNGGLRGDVHEMAATAGCRIIIEEEETSRLVEPKVREMLEALMIDYLGVSIDALLIVAPPDVISPVRDVIGKAGVESRVIGRVEEGPPASVL
ncbi:MAG: AIR synthase related protein, partial [Methanoregulaceae archaeon]|nr:AIR synthase related protein [Methanoregulaceae archaeon]